MDTKNVLEWVEVNTEAVSDFCSGWIVIDGYSLEMCEGMPLEVVLIVTDGATAKAVSITGGGADCSILTTVIPGEYNADDTISRFYWTDAQERIIWEREGPFDG